MHIITIAAAIGVGLCAAFVIVDAVKQYRLVHGTPKGATQPGESGSLSIALSVEQTTTTDQAEE